MLFALQVLHTVCRAIAAPGVGEPALGKCTVGCGHELELFWKRELGKARAVPA